MFRDRGEAHGFHFFRNLPPELFARLLAHTDCFVGNSSSGLREGSFLGTPVVTVGSRQRNREHGHNVVEVGHDAAAISDAIRDQVRHGRYECDELFGDGTAGRQIAERLAGELPPIQKELAYSVDELLDEVSG
jgi:UDP-N-acetylglucosamine 2-epimerase